MKSFFNHISKFLSLLCVFSAQVAQASEHESEAHHGNPAPGVGLLYAFINFSILVLVLYLALRKPIAEFFRVRASRTRLEIEEAKKIYDKAEQFHKEIDFKLKNAEREGHQLLFSLKEEGESERRRTVQNTKELSEKIAEDAQRIITQELKRAQELLKAETIKLAAELAAEQIEKQLTPDDQLRFGAEFVDQMKKAGNQ